VRRRARANPRRDAENDEGADVRAFD